MPQKSKAAANARPGHDYFAVVVTLVVALTILLAAINIQRFRLKQRIDVVSPVISKQAFWEDVVQKHPGYQPALHELEKYRKTGE